jgi:hypothetical protein
MSTRKAMALAGLFMILGAGLALADDQAQASVRTRARTMFMDQDCDGINDVLRDHDNDGIPNCQDPDWTRPEDGTGYKNRFGGNGSGNRNGNRQGFHGGQGWGGFGGGICDGTGPKGNLNRKGRG